ncbi:pyridoxal phosphate phosphatase PHOSPHO2-like [Rhagoletis pomonella]|uniref:pyridoxal phosphate phosphatase PHOSPHO2-like n=1 Tax=Rhagoletis pomonella TaxID=28610 RepID=UPI00177F1091|nr:pyridoxal phosphate phosphatase PHOSPHO2-like [Rhagoletis pomonella]
MAFGPPTRRLLVLDFDETLTSLDTTYLLRDLLPTYRRPKEDNFTKVGWIDYTNILLNKLRSMGFSVGELRRLIATIPPVPSIVEFVQHLHDSCDPKYDIIIISDANSIFIKDWLANHQLTKCIKAIFTNPAYVVSSDGLHVRPYHVTKCPLSPPNMCKRTILEHYMTKRREMGVNYERVIFIADGEHDYCPTLDMRSDDIVCVRKGKNLEKRMRCYRKKCKVRPLLLLWSTGHELLSLLELALGCVAISCI